MQKCRSGTMVDGSETRTVARVTRVLLLMFCEVHFARSPARESSISIPASESKPPAKPRGEAWTGSSGTRPINAKQQSREDRSSDRHCCSFQSNSTHRSYRPFCPDPEHVLASSQALRGCD